jgi:hypothetical protein
MNRREILKYTVLVTGAAISAPLASSLLLGCQREEAMSEDSGSDLAFFSESEMARVKKMVDTILPKTDSPAASEVGVHTMIDHMVGTVYPEADRQAYRQKYAQLDSYLRAEDFEKKSSEQALAVLQTLDPVQSTDLAEAGAAFLAFKQQTVAYYLNTEEIGTKFLNYLPVPGEFKPCISVDEVDNKAWAE